MICFTVNDFTETNFSELCVCVCVCVCVCFCVCERREREERDRQTDRQTDRERQKQRLIVININCNLLIENVCMLFTLSQKIIPDFFTNSDQNVHIKLRVIFEKVL